MKLMVIDDEKTVCALVGDYFRHLGYEVSTVTDSLKALAQIKTERPHIILLDINMPGLRGLPLLKRIREQDKDVKVIMVTIVDDAKTREEATAAGANAFVRKPFSTEYLENVVLGKVRELYPLIKRSKDHE